jgi:hypothetical protein
LPSCGRHQLVDDPVVEGVARHADARASQGRGPQGPTGTFEADDREVAGATAEVADQDGGVLGQGAREEKGRANGFVGVVDFLHAQPAEGGLVALQGEIGVGRSAGEGDRPPDNHPLGQVDKLVARIAPELQQKGREQILEAVAAAQHLGFAEGGRGGEGLERLDEAGFGRVFDIGVDRPGTGGDGRARSGRSGGAWNDRAGAEGEQFGFRRGEPHEARILTALPQGDDRIGGAEVYAERRRRGHGLLPATSPRPAAPPSHGC